MVLVEQKSTGNCWLIESGGHYSGGTFGRRTLIPPAEEASWKQSGLPVAVASDELFENIVQGRERIQ